MSEGPYTVSFVDKGRYKLCDANGNPVKGGSWFKEQELEFYDPFGWKGSNLYRTREDGLLYVLIW